MAKLAAKNQELQNEIALLKVQSEKVMNIEKES